MFDRPFGRRILHRADNWGQLRELFKWRISPTFNIANALCDSWASFDPERTALVHVRRSGEVEHWSFARLKEASDRMASAFFTAGVRRGDRVAQILNQGPEALITHLALFKVGAVSVPIFTLSGSAATAYRLNDCGARAVVCDGGQLDKVMALRGDLPALEAVWTNGPARSPVRAFWDDIALAQPLRSFVTTGAADPAFILYTSGATGPPKGVVHGHRMLVGQLPAVELHHPNFPQPTDLGWTPVDWSWVGSLFAVLPCMWYGVPFVSHRLPEFDPEVAWRLIRDRGITAIVSPPSVLRVMSEVPAPADHSLRSLGTGGEPVDPRTIAWAEETLGLALSQGYGLTECSTPIISSPPAMETRPGTLGLAVPGFDVAIIDEAGVELPRGQMGEIAIARPNPAMFLRYWNRPAEDEAAFIGDWLRTGDCGTQDEDGYFTFVERADDLIITAGYRLGPHEIESAASQHPAVKMVAAVGQPDPVWTQTVALFVVPVSKPVPPNLEAELAELVRSRVGTHAVPRRIEVVDALPLTASGKIRRRRLLEGGPR